MRPRARLSMRCSFKLLATHTVAALEPVPETRALCTTTESGWSTPSGSRHARALAHDERHRVLHVRPLRARGNLEEQAAAGIASHLPHRLRHRRQPRPRPRAFGNAVESSHRKVVGDANPMLLGCPDEAD